MVKNETNNDKPYRILDLTEGGSMIGGKLWETWEQM
jgi:hypothetical protein